MLLESPWLVLNLVMRPSRKHNKPSPSVPTHKFPARSVVMDRMPFSNFPSPVVTRVKRPSLNRASPPVVPIHKFRATSSHKETTWLFGRPSLVVQLVNDPS